MSEFSGFGPKTQKFLRDLGRHNEKAWFDAHRGAHEAHLPHAKIGQDLGAHAIIAHVGRESEALVGLYRVETLLILQRIRFDFVGQPNAAPFLAHIKNNTGAGCIDHFHGRMELFTAIAAQGAKGITR